MQVYSIDGVTPVVHPTAFVHPTAVLIGDVIVGADVYIGPNASLRGDFGRLIVMQGANVQDCCIMHGFPERDTVVEENGHIGHGAVLHCCRIGRNALVGMNAVVMDNAVVGESAIVAAMAFVKAGMTVPARTLAAGIPAKVLRDLSAEEMAWKVEGTKLYHDLARRSLATLQPAQPLREIEPDRKRIIMPDVKPLIEAKAEWLESGLVDKASGE